MDDLLNKNNIEICCNGQAQLAMRSILKWVKGEWSGLNEQLQYRCLRLADRVKDCISSDIQSLKILLPPCPFVALTMWCSEEEIPAAYFIDCLKEDVPHNCQQAAKFFFSLNFKFRSQLVSQFRKIFEVIHELLFTWYSSGKPFILIPLKHRGLATISYDP
ncbi:hypothetical protein RF11_05545 [Thelohanellus kitauei]|uniref:Uncharacterized protein n=1 Tax=Thelohanellus kitauei TaxID=669202 RepID=A0A0C2IGJ7_THEKT|nr:hypothetical protein RF11_05545 [Thelohanellus kitauei]